MQARNKKNQKTLDLLEGAYGVLLNPACWTQGETARTGNNQETECDSPNAKTFCGLGLICAQDPHAFKPTDLLDQYALILFNSTFINVNDSGNRKEAHKEVVQIYEEAIMSLT